MRNKLLKALGLALSLAGSHPALADDVSARYIGDGEIADFAIDLSPGGATLYLASKPTNQPLQKAKVSLQLPDNTTLQFEETSPGGVYKVNLEAKTLEKSQLVIEAGEDNDIIDVTPVGVTANVSAPANAHAHPNRNILPWIIAFVLGLACGAVAMIFGPKFLARRSDRTPANLSLILVALTASLAVTSTDSFAHGGHDHAGSSASEQAEPGAAIMLHKRAQFLIGLTTVLSKLGDIADSFVNYGHIIAKPQQDAYVLAPQAGFLRGSQNLVLGQKVTKGQSLAAIESVGRIGLTSPFNGQILEILAAEGSRVESGAKLFRITDPSTVWVDAELYEGDLLKFGKVTSASIGIEDSPESHPAKILNFMTPINEETRTAKAFLELDNSEGKLRLGSFVSIHFSLPSESKGIVLPAAAVVTRSGEDLVFVQTGPESFEARSVVTRKGAQPGTVVVVSGVKDGERVVVSGSYQLLMKAR